MIYRYERKFLITGFDLAQIIQIVMTNKGFFSELYPEREINNIYFDTHYYENFYSNVIGISKRVKHRIRWYGDIFGSIKFPNLEIKNKNGLLGYKNIFCVEPFIFGTNFKISDGIKIKNDNSDSLIIKNQFKSLTPTLINRYKRLYYISSDKNYRLTIDYDQQYFGVLNNKLLNKNHYMSNDIVLELKYNQEFDDNAYLITNDFPFRMTKNSKYINGINLLNETF